MYIFNSVHQSKVRVVLSDEDYLSFKISSLSIYCFIILYGNTKIGNKHNIVVYLIQSRKTV